MQVSELTEYFYEGDFHIAINTFLDSFYRSTEKEKLISTEPEYSEENKEKLCFIACAVHKLCNDNFISPPECIFNEKYYLKHEKYAFDTKDEKFKRHLRKVSPLEFSSRNYYVTENTLNRL